MEGERRTEVIDGVTIVHTGMYSERLPMNPNFPSYETEEIVEMYDADGNRFYSNYGAVESAQEAIERLAEEGVTAVIGPKSPLGGTNGKFYSNPNPNVVALYIVQEKKEELGTARRV